MSAIVPYGLRMPPDLKGKLEEAARSSGRSLNTEIVARLEQSIQDDDDRGVPDFTALDHDDRLTKLEAAHKALLDRVAAIEARGTTKG